MSRAINYFSIFNNIIINRICYRYLMFVITNKLLIKYTILAHRKRVRPDPFRP